MYLDPRGVLHTWADGKGGQRIEDTGALTKKRMEGIDDETVAAAKDFHQKTGGCRGTFLYLVERNADALPYTCSRGPSQ